MCEPDGGTHATHKSVASVWREADWQAGKRQSVLYVDTAQASGNVKSTEKSTPVWKGILTFCRTYNPFLSGWLRQWNRSWLVSFTNWSTVTVHVLGTDFPRKTIGCILFRNVVPLMTQDKVDIRLHFNSTRCIVEEIQLCTGVKISKHLLQETWLTAMA